MYGTAAAVDSLTKRIIVLTPHSSAELLEVRATRSQRSCSLARGGVWVNGRVHMPSRVPHRASSSTYVLRSLSLTHYRLSDDSRETARAGTGAREALTVLRAPGAWQRLEAMDAVITYGVEGTRCVAAVRGDGRCDHGPERAAGGD